MCRTARPHIYHSQGKKICPEEHTRAGDLAVLLLCVRARRNTFFDIREIMEYPKLSRFLSVKFSSREVDTSGRSDQCLYAEYFVSNKSIFWNKNVKVCDLSVCVAAYGDTHAFP